MADEWFVGGPGTGLPPVNRLELQRMIAHGQVGPQTLVWTHGMTGWLTVAVMPFLATCLPQQFQLMPQPMAMTQAPQAGPMVSCPRCRSPSVGVGQQGYGAGKGCCAALLAGPFGLLCGFCGSKKTLVNCGACGFAWTP